MAKKKTNREIVAPPSYFLSLRIQNARCFGEQGQTFCLSDDEGRPAQWTIVLGNNGLGKTTLLQGLAFFQPAVAGHTLCGARSPTVGLSWSIADPARNFTRTNSSKPAMLETHASEGFLFTEPKASWSSHGIRSAANVQEYISRLPESRDAEPETIPLPESPHNGNAARPLIFGYGVTRRMSKSSLHESGLLDLTAATATLFSAEAQLNSAEEWLLQLDYAASKKSDAQPYWRKRRKLAQDLLSDRLLPEVEQTRILPPTKTRSSSVEFKTPYGWIPLNRMSHGYQTLIAWIVDLAMRMFACHPDSDDPLSESAVVLVDEIDLHLHPKWQRQLISFLTERFPNTQFIATAHSPLIVQAASSAAANLVLLRREDDHVIIDNDVQNIQGWRVDQILTSELFGLDTARPPEYEPVLRRREELLLKESLTKKEHSELKKLNEKIHALPGGETADQATRMMKLMEEAAALVKPSDSGEA